MNVLHGALREIIDHTALWFPLIVTGILAGHALELAFKVILGLKRKKIGSPVLEILIPSLELIMVVVLVLLCFDSVVDKYLHRADFRAWYDEPFALLCLLVFFVLSSILLYVVHQGWTAKQVAAQRKPPSKPKKNK